MLILKYISKLIKILRSAATPNQIAGGFILGMVIGLTPLWSLHNLVIVVLIVILNVNIAMAMFSFILCSGFAYIFDPLFHDFGYYLLVDVSGLKGLWTSMYNIPIIALSKFNNTVVMGSLVSSIILMLPVFFLVKFGVIAYREKIDARIQKLKIVQALKSSKLYGMYEKIRDWRD
jgi:uncharacterized protein (TIGR03546 family)